MSHFTVLVSLGLIELDEESVINGIENALSPFGLNSKWDWWQWGGRWSGLLALKSGSSGLFGERSWTNRNEVFSPRVCDACFVKHLDKMKTMATYAMIVNGEWFEHGESWFGFSHDKLSDDEWCEFYWNRIGQMHPDTVIAVVDCHI